MEVYAYTNTNGNVKEYHGTLKKHPRMTNRMAFDSPNRSHLLVLLSENEGEVRGRTVWLKKPDIARARKLFDQKAKERASMLAEKCKRTLDAAKEL